MNEKSEEWSYWKSVPAVILGTFVSACVIGSHIDQGWLGYLIGSIIGFAVVNAYVVIKYKVLKFPCRTGPIWERYGKRER
ncbi:MAG: hypothetical protein QMD22_00440 [archaeon]|nr:hypothetical protein [archaeon]